MYYLLLILMLVDALLLGVVVLLQAGQGGGLASLGGGSTDLVVGGRQAVTLLTKMSWICGGIFLFLALVISFVSPTQGGAGSAVLEKLRESAPASQPASLPIETTPNQQPAAPAGAAPATPAPAPAPQSGTAPAKPAN